MKFLFSLLLVLFAGSMAHAESMGFLRIRVLDVNPEHKGQARMTSNGVEVMTFSHSVSERVSALNQSHLASGKSSPLAVDYYFGGDTCTFQYEISYSLYQQGPWIKIPGVFDAPNGVKSARLPLGSCDGTICSSDSGVQRQIQAQRLEKARKEARTLKANIERNKADRARRMQAVNAKISAARVTKVVQPKVDTQVAKDVDSSEQQAQQRFDQYAQQPSAPVELNAEEIKTQAENDYEKTQLDAFRKSLHYGEVNWVWDEAIDRTVEAYMKYGIVPSADLAEANIQAAEKRSFLSSMMNMETLTQLAMAGVRFSPVGDIIDGCEAVTGIENCLPSGRKLSALERSAAALGVIIASRQAITPVLKMLEKESRVISAEEKMLAKAIEGKKTTFANREAIKDSLRALNEDRRLGKIIENYEIKEIRLGKDVNPRWTRDGWESPFVADRPVVIGKTLEERTYRRYYVEGVNNPNGQWVMNLDAVGDLTPEQLKVKLAIKEAPTHYVDVTVPAGTEMMSGYVGKNKFGDYEGTVQHFIEDNSKVKYSAPRKISE